MNNTDEFYENDNQHVVVYCVCLKPRDNMHIYILLLNFIFLCVFSKLRTQCCRVFKRTNMVFYQYT